MRTFLKMSIFSGLMFWLASCTQSSGDPVTTVTEQVTTDNWKITLFQEDDSDETYYFSNYVFSFADNGTVQATNGAQTINGTWAPGNDDSTLKFILNFGSTSPFDELSEDWQVLEHTDTRLRLTHVSGGNGGTDFLTFERN